MRQKLLPLKPYGHLAAVVPTDVLDRIIADARS
jgi:hypothetical protein